MYIQDVIKRCNTLYPNPYSDEEKYRWCDELGATLKQEYNRTYSKIVLPCEYGSAILPDWLKYENIDRVICNGKLIKKQDFRSYGIRFMPMQYGAKLVFRTEDVQNGEVEIIFLDHYVNIRNISMENVKVVCDSDGFYMNSTPFVDGDILNIKLKSGSPIVKTLEDVYVCGVELSDKKLDLGDNENKEDKNDTDESKKSTGDFTTKVYVPNGTFQEYVGSTKRTADIERCVMEKTVCPAPYDVMYVDFVCAKMCFYQHDYEAYNQHLALVQTRLDAYAKWIKSRDPVDTDAKLVNWW